MKNIALKVSKLFAVKSFLLLLAFTMVLFSCDTLELPAEGSIPDETPPEAVFSVTPSESDHLTINFTNLSISATDYMWDFGDGNTSTAKDPTNVYSEIGTYTVSLTATDKLNVSNSTSQEIVIEEPSMDFVPVILNPGFDEEGEDSFRDGWRNGDLGTVMQITSSPIHEGVKAAKFPADDPRIAYQAITVLPDTDYILSFYYTIKTDPVGSITVSMLGGEVNDPAAIPGATLASFTGTDQSSASDYVFATLEFNSGSNETVAIYVSNEGAECRIDTFEILPL
jgi:PKD repeat protein